MDSAITSSEQSISVIIPCYNRRAVIGRALDSVFAQSVAPTEVIVVDDGSTDNTADFIQSNYPQVKYLKQVNKGVSAARNYGIRESKSRWLALLDSDDEWLPDKLQCQLAALDENDQSRIIHTEELWIRNGKRVNAMKKHQKYGGWIFEYCLPLCAMSPSSVMIHRSIFDAVGYFDESLPACEDYDMWLRMTHCYPVIFVDKPLIKKYGGHEDQLSRKYWGMDRFRIQALENLLQHVDLSIENKLAASKVLREKAQIFSAGAAKREKYEEAARYAAIADKYQPA